MSCIELNQVALDYIIKTGSDSLKNTALRFVNSVLKKDYEQRAKLKNISYRALNNITVKLNSGDRVGLIGRNGAGKSTLLRLMAKIYAPSCGTIHVNGKISGLFDVCLGMNPEATGYENIIHLAVMRGFSKKIAHSIIPDIESFTELGNFLNLPVRTYSAGMQMKLAFAVATAIPAEIILIDEIIGAGDAHFIEKATNRMTNMVEKSQIMVLTSHSNDIIERFCNKVIVLEKGEIQFFGDTREGIAFYAEAR